MSHKEKSFYTSDEYSVYYFQVSENTAIEVQYKQIKFFNFVVNCLERHQSLTILTATDARHKNIIHFGVSTEQYKRIDFFIATYSLTFIEKISYTH